MRKRTLSFTTTAPPGAKVSSVIRLREVDELDPEKLAGYPNLRKAAEILQVDPASLSRRPEVKEQTIERGREHLLAPALVLALAAHYRKRRLSAVASDLLDIAVRNAPDYVDEIEDEIDAALSSVRRPARPLEPSAFLREAKRALPAGLYRQVESAYQADGPLSPGSAYLGDD